MPVIIKRVPAQMSLVDVAQNDEFKMQFDADKSQFVLTRVDGGELKDKTWVGVLLRSENETSGMSSISSSDEEHRFFNISKFNGRIVWFLTKENPAKTTDFWPAVPNATNPSYTWGDVDEDAHPSKITYNVKLSSGQGYQFDSASELINDLFKDDWLPIETLCNKYARLVNGNVDDFQFVQTLYPQVKLRGHDLPVSNNNQISCFASAETSTTEEDVEVVVANFDDLATYDAGTATLTLKDAVDNAYIDEIQVLQYDNVSNSLTYTSESGTFFQSEDYFEVPMFSQFKIVLLSRGTIVAVQEKIAANVVPIVRFADGYLNIKLSIDTIYFDANFVFNDKSSKQIEGQHYYDKFFEFKYPADATKVEITIYLKPFGMGTLTQYPSHTFTKTIPASSASVSGCTDETATNYNPNATVDDMTCEYGFNAFAKYDPDTGMLTLTQQAIDAGISAIAVNAVDGSGQGYTITRDEYNAWTTESQFKIEMFSPFQIELQNAINSLQNEINSLATKKDCAANINTELKFQDYTLQVEVKNITTKNDVEFQGNYVFINNSGKAIFSDQIPVSSKISIVPTATNVEIWIVPNKGDSNVYQYIRQPIPEKNRPYLKQTEPVASEGRGDEYVQCTYEGADPGSGSNGACTYNALYAKFEKYVQMLSVYEKMTSTQQWLHLDDITKLLQEKPELIENQVDKTIVFDNSANVHNELPALDASTSSKQYSETDIDTIYTELTDKTTSLQTKADELALQSFVKDDDDEYVTVAYDTPILASDLFGFGEKETISFQTPAAVRVFSDPAPGSAEVDINVWRLGNFYELGMLDTFYDIYTSPNADHAQLFKEADINKITPGVFYIAQKDIVLTDIPFTNLPFLQKFNIVIYDDNSEFINSKNINSDFITVQSLTTQQYFQSAKDAETSSNLISETIDLAPGANQFMKNKLILAKDTNGNAVYVHSDDVKVTFSQKKIPEGTLFVSYYEDLAHKIPSSDDYDETKLKIMQIGDRQVYLYKKISGSDKYNWMFYPIWIRTSEQRPQVGKNNVIEFKRNTGQTCLHDTVIGQEPNFVFWLDKKGTQVKMTDSSNTRLCSLHKRNTSKNIKFRVSVSLVKGENYVFADVSDNTGLPKTSLHNFKVYITVTENTGHTRTYEVGRFKENQEMTKRFIVFNRTFERLHTYSIVPLLQAQDTFMVKNSENPTKTLTVKEDNNIFELNCDDTITEQFLCYDVFNQRFVTADAFGSDLKDGNAYTFSYSPLVPLENSLQSSKSKEANFDYTSLETGVVPWELYADTGELKDSGRFIINTAGDHKLVFPNILETDFLYMPTLSVTPAGQKICQTVFTSCSNPIPIFQKIDSEKINKTLEQKYLGYVNANVQYDACATDKAICMEDNQSIVQLQKNELEEVLEKNKLAYVVDFASKCHTKPFIVVGDSAQDLLSPSTAHLGNLRKSSTNISRDDKNYIQLDKLAVDGSIEDVIILLDRDVTITAFGFEDGVEYAYCIAINPQYTQLTYVDEKTWGLNKFTACKIAVSLLTYYETIYARFAQFKTENGALATAHPIATHTYEFDLVYVGDARELVSVHHLTGLTLKDDDSVLLKRTIYQKSKDQSSVVRTLPETPILKAFSYRGNGREAIFYHNNQLSLKSSSVDSESCITNVFQNVAYTYPGSGYACPERKSLYGGTDIDDVPEDSKIDHTALESDVHKGFKFSSDSTKNIVAAYPPAYTLTRDQLNELVSENGSVSLFNVLVQVGELRQYRDVSLRASVEDDDELVVLIDGAELEGQLKTIEFQDDCFVYGDTDCDATIFDKNDKKFYPVTGEARYLLKIAQNSKSHSGSFLQQRLPSLAATAAQVEMDVAETDRNMENVGLANPIELPYDLINREQGKKYYYVNVYGKITPCPLIQVRADNGKRQQKVIVPHNFQKKVIDKINVFYDKDANVELVLQVDNVIQLKTFAVLGKNIQKKNSNSFKIHLAQGDVFHTHDPTSMNDETKNVFQFALKDSSTHTVSVDYSELKEYYVGTQSGNVLQFDPLLMRSDVDNKTGVRVFKVANITEFNLDERVPEIAYYKTTKPYKHSKDAIRDFYNLFKRGQQDFEKLEFFDSTSQTTTNTAWFFEFDTTGSSASHILITENSTETHVLESGLEIPEKNFQDNTGKFSKLYKVPKNKTISFFGVIEPGFNKPEIKLLYENSQFRPLTYSARCRAAVFTKDYTPFLHVEHQMPRIDLSSAEKTRQPLPAISDLDTDSKQTKIQLAATVCDSADSKRKLSVELSGATFDLRYGSTVYVTAELPTNPGIAVAKLNPVLFALGSGNSSLATASTDHPYLCLDPLAENTFQHFPCFYPDISDWIKQKQTLAKATDLTSTVSALVDYHRGDATSPTRDNVDLEEIAKDSETNGQNSDVFYYNENKLEFMRVGITKANLQQALKDVTNIFKLNGEFKDNTFYVQSTQFTKSQAQNALTQMAKAILNTLAETQENQADIKIECSSLKVFAGGLRNARQAKINKFVTALEKFEQKKFVRALDFVETDKNQAWTVRVLADMTILQNKNARIIKLLQIFSSISQFFNAYSVSVVDQKALETYHNAKVRVALAYQEPGNTENVVLLDVPLRHVHLNTEIGSDYRIKMESYLAGKELYQDGLWDVGVVGIVDANYKTGKELETLRNQCDSEQECVGLVCRKREDGDEECAKISDQNPKLEDKPPASKYAVYFRNPKMQKILDVFQDAEGKLTVQPVGDADAPPAIAPEQDAANFADNVVLDPHTRAAATNTCSAEQTDAVESIETYLSLTRKEQRLILKSAKDPATNTNLITEALQNAQAAIHLCNKDLYKNIAKEIQVLQRQTLSNYLFNDCKHVTIDGKQVKLQHDPAQNAVVCALAPYKTMLQCDGCGNGTLQTEQDQHASSLNAMTNPSLWQDVIEDDEFDHFAYARGMRMLFRQIRADNENKSRYPLLWRQTRTNVKFDNSIQTEVQFHIANLSDGTFSFRHVSSQKTYDMKISNNKLVGVKILYDNTSHKNTLYVQYANDEEKYVIKYDGTKNSFQYAVPANGLTFKAASNAENTLVLPPGVYQITSAHTTNNITVGGCAKRISDKQFQVLPARALKNSLFTDTGPTPSHLPILYDGNPLKALQPSITEIDKEFLLDDMTRDKDAFASFLARVIKLHDVKDYLTALDAVRTKQSKATDSQLDTDKQTVAKEINENSQHLEDLNNENRRLSYLVKRGYTLEIVDTDKVDESGRYLYIEAIATEETEKAKNNAKTIIANVNDALLFKASEQKTVTTAKAVKFSERIQDILTFETDLLTKQLKTLQTAKTKLDEQTKADNKPPGVKALQISEPLLGLQLEQAGTQIEARHFDAARKLLITATGDRSFAKDSLTLEEIACALMLASENKSPLETIAQATSAKTKGISTFKLKGNQTTVLHIRLDDLKIDNDIISEIDCKVGVYHLFSIDTKTLKIKPYIAQRIVQVKAQNPDDSSEFLVVFESIELTPKPTLQETFEGDYLDFSILGVLQVEKTELETLINLFEDEQQIFGKGNVVRWFDDSLVLDAKDDIVTRYHFGASTDDATKATAADMRQNMETYEGGTQLPAYGSISNMPVQVNHVSSEHRHAPNSRYDVLSLPPPHIDHYRMLQGWQPDHTLESASITLTFARPFAKGKYFGVDIAYSTYNNQVLKSITAIAKDGNEEIFFDHNAQPNTVDFNQLMMNHRQTYFGAQTSALLAQRCLFAGEIKAPSQPVQQLKFQFTMNGKPLRVNSVRATFRLHPYLRPVTSSSRTAGQLAGEPSQHHIKYDEETGTNTISFAVERMTQPVSPRDYRAEDMILTLLNKVCPTRKIRHFAPLRRRGWTSRMYNSATILKTNKFSASKIYEFCKKNKASETHTTDELTFLQYEDFTNLNVICHSTYIVVEKEETWKVSSHDNKNDYYSYGSCYVDGTKWFEFNDEHYSNTLTLEKGIHKIEILEITDPNLILYDNSKLQKLHPTHIKQTFKYSVNGELKTLQGYILNIDPDMTVGQICKEKNLHHGHLEPLQAIGLRPPTPMHVWYLQSNCKYCLNDTPRTFHIDPRIKHALKNLKFDLNLSWRQMRQIARMQGKHYLQNAFDIAHKAFSQ